MNAGVRSSGDLSEHITLRIKVQSAHVSKISVSSGLREALLEEKHDKRQDSGHHGTEEATVCLCCATVIKRILHNFTMVSGANGVQLLSAQGQ